MPKTSNETRTKSSCSNVEKKKWSVFLVVASFLFSISASSNEPKSQKGKNVDNKLSEKVLERNPNQESKSNDINAILDKLDYPELQVVPRASQRLKMEAMEEDSNWYYAHWQVELAGLSTLYLGITAKSMERADLNATQSADATTFYTITQAVGLGWLVAGAVMGAKKPYNSGVQMASRFSEKGERGALLRERLAEEALERPARVMQILSVASMWSCLFTNVYTGTYLSDKGKVTASLAVMMSLLPMAFQDHSVTVYQKHLEYKKKIYGPMTSMGLGVERSTGAFYPMTQLSWNF